MISKSEITKQNFMDEIFEIIAFLKNNKVNTRNCEICNLALEEIFTNEFKYGNSVENYVVIKIKKNEDIELLIYSQGTYFDSANYSNNVKIVTDINLMEFGGLGLKLIKKLSKSFATYKKLNWQINKIIIGE